MARTNQSSTYTVLAALLAVALIATAGITYFDEPGAGGNETLAAVSQAIPLHAGNAISGIDGEFDRLEANLQKLAGLRSSSSGRGLPGDRIHRGDR